MGDYNPKHDIVRRLRGKIYASSSPTADEIMTEAADTIEELRHRFAKIEPSYREQLNQQCELTYAAIKDCESLRSQLADLTAEVERLRELLREAQGFIVPGDDAGCTPGECAECDMHRLALRIDAALAGAEPTKEKERE